MRSLSLQLNWKSTLVDHQTLGYLTNIIYRCLDKILTYLQSLINLKKIYSLNIANRQEAQLQKIHKTLNSIYPGQILIYTIVKEFI